MPIQLAPEDSLPQRSNHQTLRMMARIRKGGERLRVRFDNTFCVATLTRGRALIACLADEAAIVEGSDRGLTFGRETAAPRR